VAKGTGGQGEVAAQSLISGRAPARIIGLPADRHRGGGSDLSGATDSPGPDMDQRRSWVGNVTWRETAALREELFDALEVPGAISLRLDVRAVNSIDRSGIALLIGANHRATATGRQLVLIDANGVVTNTLSRMRFAGEFAITQVVTPAAAGG